MPVRAQGERLNQLSEVVAQLGLHLKTMAGLIAPEAVEVLDHIQQLVDIANQAADSRSPRFDFGMAPTEEDK